MRLQDVCNTRLFRLVVVVPDRVGEDSMAMRFVDVVEADVGAVLFYLVGKGWRL